MPVVLSKEQIDTIQKMRYDGASNDDIKKAVPAASDSMIGTYAPSELRGGKRRLAEYIGQHPGVDFKDLNFRAFDVDPNRAAGQIRDLQRAGLLTFKEGRIALMRGDHHTAGGSNEKGMYSITLTPMGERRVEASKLIDQVAAKSSGAHAAIADKVSTKTKKSKDSPVNGQTEFRLLPPEILEQRAVELNPSIAEPAPVIGGIPVELPTPLDIVDDRATEPIVEAAENAVMTFAERIHDMEVKYPILTELRKREGRVSAANRLVGQALDLYDSADLTEEALALLEHLRKTDVKFSPIERELMKLAEDQGI